MPALMTKTELAQTLGELIKLGLVAVVLDEPGKPTRYSPTDLRCSSRMQQPAKKAAVQS